MFTIQVTNFRLFLCWNTEKWPCNCKLKFRNNNCFLLYTDTKVYSENELNVGFSGKINRRKFTWNYLGSGRGKKMRKINPCLEYIQEPKPEKCRKNWNRKGWKIDTRSTKNTIRLTFFPFKPVNVLFCFYF